MSTGVQTAVGQIVWHTLVTNDIEQAKSFYGQLLGWEYEAFDAGETTVPMIKQHGISHGGLRPVAPGVPPHWFGYVLVADLDETIGKVGAAGGSVVAPAMQIPSVGRIAVFADAQGAVIAGFAPDGEMAKPTGTFLWDELLTEDIEDAKRFYRDVFGWTAADMDVGPGPYTMFSVDDVQTAGGMTKPAEDPGPSRWWPYMATEDVDATVARAKELGGMVFLEGMDVPTVGRIAVLGDPTGATFGIYKPSA